MEWVKTAEKGMAIGYREAATAPILLVLLLAACSRPIGPDKDGAAADGNAVHIEGPVKMAPDATAADPPRDGFGGATAGGDGSQIVLSALTETDLAAATLSGELACSFTAGDGAALLVARGNVRSKEPAQGVIKLIDYAEPVWAEGGFDAMVRGATFSGKGKTITIAPTGDAIGGGESPPRPASLTFERADGARRVVAGRWNCGP